MRMSRRQALGTVLLVSAVWSCLLCLAYLPRGSDNTYTASGKNGEICPPVFPEGYVRINSASPDELTALPGIGESLARAVTDERDANGPFYYPEDVLAVRGIGEKKLEAIRPFLNLSEGER